MTELGYIALYRKIQHNFLWKEGRVFSKLEAWLDILMEVQHDIKPQKVLIKNKIIICEHGESLKSLETWAMRWRWNRSQVRRYFLLLKRESMIVLKPTQQTTHLKVVNYSTYDIKCNNKRNASETQLTPDNNVKKEKKKKNTINGAIYDSENDHVMGYSQRFYTFWKNYPASKKKKDCANAWKKYKCEDKLELILKALEWQVKTEQWRKGFIPHSLTYLNGQQWEDEPVRAIQTQSGIIV